MPQSTARAHPLVMITGASSGIGKALALSFAHEGHPLLLIARHIEPIAGLPADTIYRQADVADYAAMTAAVGTAAAVHGPVECLVNNAGMADARAFDEVDEASYARELDTNLKGVFNGTKAVLPG
jgi:NADP-dependent 3-hydroxy acid dehydrogenase YdfG